MNRHEPLGGKIVTGPFIVLGILALIGVYYMVERFLLGLGGVASINDGYSWGIWIVYDILVATALACGGLALAFTVYVFNRGKYHPLVRPALTASLCGYALGGFGAFFDLGRWWQFYNVLWPGYMNFNSVMLEVALCVMAYILVLVIEFAPALLEKMGAKNSLETLNRLLFFFIALGVVLPVMHQSSFGTLLIAMGYRVTPLWQSVELQPLFAILTALTMGFSIVIFEASLTTVGFHRPLETPLLAGLGKAIMGLLAVYLVVRFVELAVRGKLGLAFAGDLHGNMFLLETALFVIPLIILVSPGQRRRGRMLLLAAVSMLFAGILYRFNAFLVGFDPGPGYSYFPAVGEIMVTVGFVAIELMAYLVFVKTLPVLPRVQHA